MAVWISYQADALGHDVQAICRELLSPAERERELRFRFAEDQHLYLVTRALVRTVLGRYLAMPPLDLRFESMAFGRPRLVAQTEQSERLSFNISHTRGLVVLAVACEREVGIDVESLKRPDLRDIAENFFAASEVADLRALATEQQGKRFFELWTLKESYIKARSMGLQIPLSDFAFRLLGQDALTLWLHPRLQDRTSRWTFWQFGIAGGFLASLCLEAGPESSIAVETFRATPLLEDIRPAALEPPFRSSAAHHLAFGRGSTWTTSPAPTGP